MNNIFITPELMKDLTKLTTSYLNEFGEEVNNPKPMAIPSGLKRPPTLQEQIKRVLRTELSRQVSEQGMETFEEAFDFDVDEDPEPMGKYDVMEDEVPLTVPLKNESEVKNENGSDNKVNDDGVLDDTKGSTEGSDKQSK